jgi:hypothetical protein
VNRDWLITPPTLSYLTACASFGVEYEASVRRLDWNGINKERKMTDQKWRSPTGHPIASHETDHIPDGGRKVGDVSLALSWLNNCSDAMFSDLSVKRTIRNALAKQQPDAELRSLVNKIMGYHPDYNGKITRHSNVDSRITTEQHIGLETINYLNYRAEQKGVNHE